MSRRSKAETSPVRLQLRDWYLLTPTLIWKTYISKSETFELTIFLTIQLDLMLRKGMIAQENADKRCRSWW
ncbi:unnamed protein product [Brassica oleracea var. botrytis]